MKKYLILFLILCSAGYASILPTPEQSDEERISRASTDLANQMNGSLDNLKSNVSRCWGLFWNNPSATPQEICDKFGGSAYKIFLTSSKVQEAILAIDPTYTPLVPEYEFTINQDGTVTIGDLIEPTPE